MKNDEGRRYSAPARSNCTRGERSKESGCDNCGEPATHPYLALRFQGRIPRLCTRCLEKLAHGVGQVDRATCRAA